MSQEINKYRVNHPSFCGLRRSSEKNFNLLNKNKSNKSESCVLLSVSTVYQKMMRENTKRYKTRKKIQIKATSCSLKCSKINVTSVKPNNHLFLMRGGKETKNMS